VTRCLTSGAECLDWRRDDEVAGCRALFLRTWEPSKEWNHPTNKNQSGRFLLTIKKVVRRNFIRDGASCSALGHFTELPKNVTLTVSFRLAILIYLFIVIDGGFRKYFIRNNDRPCKKVS
jgi:hypothetical protein